MSFFDGFIDSMHAVSRRLEAKADLIRAECPQQEMLARAFRAGAMRALRLQGELSRFNPQTLGEAIVEESFAYKPPKTDPRP